MSVKSRVENTGAASRRINIGKAAKASGVPEKMIRHYESIGLISRVQRTDANYRTYSESDVYTLRFVKQARSVGFSIEQIRRLLTLWQDRRRPAVDVQRSISIHLVEFNERIRALKAMINALETLAACCDRDDRPHCPVLEHWSRSTEGPFAGRETR
jgi:MerR family copper efflux transcriptional regulator